MNPIALAGDEAVTSSLVLGGVMVRRGKFTLGPVSIGIRSGAVTALVGANGAGKTTLLRALMGQLPLWQGSARWGDVAVDLRSRQWRGAVGYVPDSADELLAECSAEELWSFSVGVHAANRQLRDRSAAREAMLARAYELAGQLAFEPPPGQVIAEYSLGMRKKTQLVAALLHDPAILILDEPRNGLDPFGIDQLHRLLTAAADVGAAVIVASHDLAWALTHADQMVALRRGQVVLDQPVDTVVRSGGEAKLLQSLT